MRTRPWVGLGLLLAAGACRKDQAVTAPSADPNLVIATYSGGQFTRAEIEPLLANRLARQPAASDEERATALRAVLERRTRVRLLYDDARREGLLERAAVRLVLEAQERRLLADDWLQRHVASSASASPQTVAAELQKRLAAEQPQQLRRFSHIFLRAPQEDATARERARATMATIRKQLAEGQSFEELARKHSDSITARGGGQVEWTSKEPLHDRLAEVLFGMVEGQTSEPLETESGLHLFRLDGIRRPAAADPQALRAQIQSELDAEAARAAVQAERARTFDLSGVSVDAAQLARRGNASEVLVRAAGQPLTREQFETLAQSLPGAARLPRPELLKQLVVDALLAERRRAEPVDAALKRRLDDARLDYVVELRRKELVDGLAVAVTPQEEAEYYAKNKDSAPELRDHLIDLLFFEQSGPSPAQVYGQAEVVSRRLRDGERFEAILDALPKKPGLIVKRGLSAGDLVNLRSESMRLAKALGALEPGGVSPPLYMDGESVSFRQARPVLQGKGVLFVRLAAIAPLPLEATRARIHAALLGEKQAAGVVEIQRQLAERGQLRILVTSF